MTPENNDTCSGLLSYLKQSKIMNLILLDYIYNKVEDRLEAIFSLKKPEGVIVILDAFNVSPITVCVDNKEYTIDFDLTRVYISLGGKRHWLLWNEVWNKLKNKIKYGEYFPNICHN